MPSAERDRPRFASFLPALGCITWLTIAIGIAPAVGQSSDTAAPLPATCDDPGGAFLAERTPLDETHRRTIALVRNAYEQDRAQKSAVLVEPMRHLVERTARAEGHQSPRTAMLRADLADLLVASNASGDPAVQKSAAQLRDEALRVLDRERTVEATGTLIETVYRLLAARRDADAHVAYIALLKRHREVFGDRPSSILLWRSAIASASADEEKERLARAQLSSATANGDARWLLEARGELLEVVWASLIGNDDADQNTYRQLLSTSDQRAGELSNLARAMRPDVLARLLLARSEPEPGCSWYEPAPAEKMARTLIVLGNPTEARDALRILVLAAATPGAFATDMAGAISNISPILAARTVDREMFLDGMRRVGRHGDGGLCAGAPEYPEICALRIAASSLVSLGAPTAAIPLLRDALAVIDEKGADQPTLMSVLADLADAEWRYGTASIAPELLQRVQQIAGRSFEGADRKTRFTLLLLRTLIADAQLDDAGAMNAYEDLVDYGIRVIRSAPPSNTVSGMQYSVDDDFNLKNHVNDALGQLTRRHVRGQFCPACGEAGAVADSAISWLNAVFDPILISGPHPSAIDVLVAKIQINRQDVKIPTNALENASFRILSNYFHGDSHERALLAIARAIPNINKADGENLLLAMTILSEAPLATMDVDESTLNFIDFLIEKRLDLKRLKWEAYAAGIYEDSFEQFGADVPLYETLDEMARGLILLNYPLAAQVVLESMIDRIVDGASSGVVQDPDSFERLADLAGLSVSALSRLAGFSTGRGDFARAGRQLDLAGEILRRKIGSEWRVGNERAAAALRELRSAARLIAQTRARIAVNPKAKPGAGTASGATAERLFADLQIAMLSETALATQAADRRRVASERALLDAIQRRDDAVGAIVGLEQFRYAAELYGLTSVEDQVARLSAERDSANRVVEALLPVPEDMLSPAPLLLTEAQRSLQPDEALLVLHAGTDAVYGFALRSHGAPTVWISKMTLGELEARIAGLRAGVDVAGGLPRFSFNEASSLYTDLLGPADGVLSEARHVLVVSDGPLQSLPLAVLLTEPLSEPPVTLEEIRMAKVPWFVRRSAITVLPSVRAVASRASKRLASQASIAFAGIGDPVLAGEPESQRAVDFGVAFARNGIADVEALRRLPRLPATAIEITTMGRALRSSDEDLLLGPSATETSVKNMPLANYRVITFATHGLVAGAVKGSSEPGLVLTPPAIGTREDDGFLTSSEISSLSFDADLVVLSACNTATSDGRPRAEGLSGLARAFLTAGARSVVATHWAIPSEPTVEVTTRMVAARERDPPLDWGRALRSAMLSVADEVGPPEFAHPANWGAFIAIGLPPSAQ